MWETVNIARDAGFIGDYYIMTDSVEDTMQSRKEGLNVCEPILKHPSRLFKKNNNIKYGLVLKLKWGLVSLIDLLISLLIFSQLFRRLLWSYISCKETLNLYKDADAIFVKGGGFIHG